MSEQEVWAAQPPVSESGRAHSHPRGWGNVSPVMVFSLMSFTICLRDEIQEAQRGREAAWLPFLVLSLGTMSP